MTIIARYAGMLSSQVVIYVTRRSVVCKLMAFEALAREAVAME